MSAGPLSRANAPKPAGAAAPSPAGSYGLRCGPGAPLASNPSGPKTNTGTMHSSFQAALRPPLQANVGSRRGGQWLAGSPKNFQGPDSRPLPGPIRASEVLRAFQQGQGFGSHARTLQAKA